MDQEDNIIRTRLSVNERPLRRLATRYQKWATSLADGSEQDIDGSLESLLLEISYFELGLSKSKLVMEMAERERIHYDQEQQEILNSIVVSQAELEDLAQELEVAKRERTHKIQYDELALELGKFPSREASQASIAALETEIQELEWESRQQDLAMTQRKQQFDMALQSLVTMQESIQQEQLDVVKRQFLKRTTQEDDDALDDEEEGFVEAQGENGSAQTTESTAAKVSTPAADGQQEQLESEEQQPPSADGLERVLSMEGHHRHSSSSDRSRRGGSESPRDLDSPSMSVIVSESTSVGGDVFVVDLQTHSTMTPTNLSVLNMEQASTPTPSSSQTSTPVNEGV